GEQVDLAYVVVVAAAGQELPKLPSQVQVVTDRWPNEGPLMGIATGLTALPADRKWTLVCSCDLPMLKPDVLALLWPAVGQSDANPECEAVVPRVDGKWQPLAAIYQTRLLPVVHDLLRQGRRRVSDFLEAISVRELREEELLQVDAELVSFRHCNTPEE